MNAIQIRDRIDFYNDLTRHPRFFIEDYVKAVNDAIKVFIDNMFGDVNNRQPYDLQFIQQIRDNLYTLYQTASPAVSNGTAVTTVAGSFIPSAITLPTDYYTLISLSAIIGGVTVYSRPTSYNELGPLLENTYKKPSNSKIYHNETSTGLTIWRGSTGSVTSATMTYIKKPATYSLGASSQYIEPGAAVLTIGQVYIACEESSSAGVTYVSGTSFTATVTALTSGQVILASNTTTTDLPDKVHETIAKMASAIMLGVTGNLQGSAIVNNEVNKNN